MWWCDKGEDEERGGEGRIGSGWLEWKGRQ